MFASVFSFEKTDTMCTDVLHSHNPSKGAGDYAAQQASPSPILTKDNAARPR